MTEDKRFIEEILPIKEIGIEGSKEKNIRRGNISSLHIWWTRKPMTVSRAIVYASLIGFSHDLKKIDENKKIIIELSKWSNNLNKNIIEIARKNIQDKYGGRPIRILDPFAGGGSIPLECMRLGCEVFSSDYNPVAVLIEKCTMEYPYKYGILKKEKNNWGGFSRELDKNILFEDVKKWGNIIFEDLKDEIKKFYLSEDDNSTPIAYLWARTLLCQNPSCSVEIPLMPHYWLAKTNNKNIALFPYSENKKLYFKIVGTGYEKIPTNFNPDKGTVSKAIVTCPVCNSTIDSSTTRRLFKSSNSNNRMIAIVYQNQNKGKEYRVTTENDMRLYNDSEIYLHVLEKELYDKWGMPPMPNETIPEGKGRGAERGFSLRNYNLNTWGDIFNSRQKITLLILADKIKECYPKIVNEVSDEEYAKAICSYLAMTFDRMASSYNTLTQWQAGSEKLGNMFSRAILSFSWNYAEANAISGAVRSWESLFSDTLNIIESVSKIDTNNYDFTPRVTQASSTNLPHPDDYFDAIFTDPPYYDNVPYSYLSDFFYVWLKRILGDMYPELFSTPLSPKSKEIVAYTFDTSWEESKTIFENNLKLCFKEIFRVLKSGGIASIIYAHKTTEGWETLINSLLDSGLVITAAWPVNTERSSRMRAQESAALGSSIYIIARKFEKTSTGFYNNVKEELKSHLNYKLNMMWDEGIVGADFFIAAIGSGIEVFGKYDKVIDYEGNIIRADKLLEEVSKIATDYAIKQILKNGFASEISKLTLFYVLWRWEFGEGKAPFDEARKLAQSAGIDLSIEWARNSFIKKQKEFIEVLNPKERKLEDLEGSDELIDVLHYCLLMWEKGNKDKILEVLSMTGFGKTDIFYRVAQAISETLPKDSKEKKLLDGFLSGKEKLKKDISDKVVNKQQRLDELI